MLYFCVVLNWITARSAAVSHFLWLLSRKLKRQLAFLSLKICCCLCLWRQLCYNTFPLTEASTSGIALWHYNTKTAFIPRKSLALNSTGGGSCIWKGVMFQIPVRQWNTSREVQLGEWIYVFKSLLRAKTHHSGFTSLESYHGSKCFIFRHHNLKVNSGSAAAFALPMSVKTAPMRLASCWVTSCCDETGAEAD